MDNKTVSASDSKLDIVVNINDIRFTSTGEIVAYEFRSAFCTETRNGVEYSTTVSCFLCGETRAAARCAAVLSSRLDSLNPTPSF